MNEVNDIVYYSYYGYIKNVKGKPIKGAVVSFSGDIQLQPVKTDHTGRYQFEIPAEMKETEVTVCIRHSEYVESNQRILPAENPVLDDITLNFTVATFMLGTSEQVFKFTLVCSVLVGIFGVFTILMDLRGKESFSSQSGKITFIGNEHPHLRWFRDPEEFRYLKIDTHPFVFEMYIGEDSDAVKYERIDDLQTGDAIKIYYDKMGKDGSQKTIRGIKFIDKGNVTVFEKGFDVGGGMLFICISLVILLFNYWVWRSENRKLEMPASGKT